MESSDVDIPPTHISAVSSASFLLIFAALDSTHAVLLKSVAI